MAMSASQIASILEELATLMDLSGENVFKVKAHQNAARVLDSLQGSFSDLLEQAKQGKVRGIGPAIYQKIEILARDGKLDELDALRASFPAGVLAMLRVPGLGPKKVGVLYHELKITSLEELATACREGIVAGKKGFGEKTQAKILEGIERLKSYSDQFLFSQANAVAEELVNYLKASGSCTQVVVAGSLRRCKEIVKDIDLLACSTDPVSLMSVFVGFHGVTSVTGQGETKSSIVLNSGLAVDLRVVEESQFGAALLYFTGSKAHNTHLRGIAQDQGYKLNEYGLWKDEARLPLATEQEIFNQLGLAFVPPELREDLGEIEQAQKAKDKNKDIFGLVQRKELRGVMHAHTTYSDGRDPLLEMAKAVKKAGYEYFVVTDHSRSAAYAGGLSIERVKQQQREIDALNKELTPFKIFKGIESDILQDGSLDYPDEILQSFDVIIASVHSQFSMSEEQMTARIIAAIRNKYTTVVGHLTGRLLLQRDGYQVNIPEVLKVAAEEGVAVEINANPHRLDLDWRHVRLAKSLGIKIPIGPDAHAIEAVEDIRYGVGIARKGQLTKDDVLNCLPLNEFEKFIKARRNR